MPAHDPNGLLLVNVITLPQVNVMNDDGTMNDLAFEFVGMDRFEVVRQSLLSFERNPVALLKIENVSTVLVTLRAAGVVVEPRLSTQWFVKMDHQLRTLLPIKTQTYKVESLPTSFQRYLP